MEDESKCLRITHDDEADAAYIYLRNPLPPGAAVRTVPVALPDTIPASILLDFDGENRLIGLEVLGARRALPEQLLDVGHRETMTS